MLLNPYLAHMIERLLFKNTADAIFLRDGGLGLRLLQTQFFCRHIFSADAIYSFISTADAFFLQILAEIGTLEGKTGRSLI